MKNKLLMATTLVMTLSACNDDAVSPTMGNSFGSIDITGDLVPGNTLSADVTDANGLTNATIAYTWMLDGAVISGQTASTYVIADSDVGSELSVSVTYIDDDGYDSSIISQPTDAVPTPPVDDPGTVTVTGILVEEQVLTATVTDDNGIDSDITYEWFANGTVIAGASGTTYTLTAAEIGKVITVSASYQDNDKFVGAPVSAATTAVEAKPSPDDNVEGAVTISATEFVIGTEVTAVVADANGVGEEIFPQWFADGVAIAGAANSSFTPTLAEVGKTLSVEVTYTDNNGFAEDVSTEATERVYSYIVTNEADLQSAVASLVEGDWIALASASGGDYADMAEVAIDVANITLTLTQTSSAVISGATCLVFNGDNAVVDGLNFEETNFIIDSTCDADGGNSTLFINGNNSVVRNSTFSGDIATDEYAMLASKGNDNLIERNEFSDRNMELKSAAVVIFNNSSEGSQERTTVQYNYFRDMGPESGEAGDRRSDASVIQVGRSTGSDSTGAGEHVVKYNLFENILVDKRVMRVQTSNSTIEGNTIIDSTGMISIEDGAQNTVKNNIIIPTGDDSDDGGISFTTMAHTITNNYVENSRTTSGDRGALFVFSDPLNNSGNGEIMTAGEISLVTVIANNTVVNARHGLAFDDKDCKVLSPTLDVDNNFIANLADDDNGKNSEAVAEKDFVEEPCTVNAATDYDGNQFYADELSDTGTFSFNGGAADNMSGTTAETPALTRDDANLASGPTAGVGADTSKLYKISATEVGPNTTWVK